MTRIMTRGCCCSGAPRVCGLLWGLTLGEGASRIRTRPGVMVRNRLVALKLDQLLVFGAASSELIGPAIPERFWDGGRVGRRGRGTTLASLEALLEHAALFRRCREELPPW